MIEILRQKINELQFENFGVLSLQNSFPEQQHFLSWIDQGFHASMEYLAERKDERADIQRYFPGAQSAIVCTMHYAKKHKPNLEADPIRVARYARGKDYHNVFTKRLRKLAAVLEQNWNCKTRVCVDTAPVLDRALAYHSGLGWFGKNTCLIDPKRGSYFFIGSILTTAQLPELSTSAVRDHCGTCTRCLDACPTQAFVAPLVLDARRCISYWNIEHRGEIPKPIQTQMNGWLFGCDICQEVCPWNHQKETDIELFIDAAYQSIETIHELKTKIRNATQDSFSMDFAGRPLKRARLEGLKRNLKIVENQGKI